MVEKLRGTDTLQALSSDIESVRAELYKAAKQKEDNFLDSEIIALSQKLDLLIVKYQQVKRCSIS